MVKFINKLWFSSEHYVAKLPTKYFSYRKLSEFVPMNANNGEPDTGIGVTSDMGVHIMVYSWFSNNPSGRLLSHQQTCDLISVRSFCVRFISSVRTPLGLWCFSLKIAPFSISFNYRIPVHREIFRNIWWDTFEYSLFSPISLLFKTNADDILQVDRSWLLPKSNDERISDGLGSEEQLCGRGGRVQADGANLLPRQSLL